MSRLALRLLQIAFVAVVYALAAWFGTDLAVAQGVITPVWIPAGIAVAALWVVGPWAAAGVYLGAVIGNVASDAALGTSLLIAIGNTGSALLGWYLLRRAKFSPRMERLRDVFAFAALPVALAPVLAASNGVAVLWGSGTIERADLGSSWFLWWFGDAMGVLLAAGLLLVWGSSSRALLELSPWRHFEGAALIALTVGCSSFVFLASQWDYRIALLPLLIWGALRFTQIGAVTTVCIIGACGIAAALDGGVDIQGSTPTQTVQLVQALIGVAMLTTMVLAATLAERRRAEASLRIASDELSQLYEHERGVSRELREVAAMKDSILTAVSHELRTPLTAIMGFALTLNERRDEFDAATTSTMLTHMAQQAQRLDKLLVDLLDIDRIRRGAARADFQRTDVTDLVRRTVEAIPSDERSVTMDVASITLDVDRVKLERVVENLVVNALKHTPPDTQVRINLRREIAGALIVVEDTGPGVPDANKESIFEPFDRGDNKLTHAPGTGIGLALVSQYVAMHNGMSWVEDRPGGGAAFHVLLPWRGPATT